NQRRKSVPLSGTFAARSRSPSKVPPRAIPLVPPLPNSMSGSQPNTLGLNASASSNANMDVDGVRDIPVPMDDSSLSLSPVVKNLAAVSIDGGFANRSATDQNQTQSQSRAPVNVESGQNQTQSQSRSGSTQIQTHDVVQSNQSSSSSHPSGVQTQQ